MPASVNNLLVDALRTGARSAVAPLFMLGHGPQGYLDRVEEGASDILAASGPAVSSHSIWFWVHQAPLADAAEHCWSDWLARELNALPARARGERLLGLLEEAVTAALSSGQAAALVSSWERCLECVGEAGDRWSRDTMLNVLKNRLIVHGDEGAPVLTALHDAGYVIRPDVQRWAMEPFGVIEQAQEQGMPLLAGELLAVLSEPEPGYLEKLAQQLDRRLVQTLDTGWAAWQTNASGERILRCYAGLVERGLPPHRPLPPAVDAPSVDWPAALRAHVLQRQVGPVAGRSSRPRF